MRRFLTNGLCSEAMRRFGKPGSVRDVVSPTSLPRCLTRKGTVLFLDCFLRSFGALILLENVKI